VSLGNLLAPPFMDEPHLWSADRFHPSAAGYRRLVDAMLPSLLEALGVEIPVSVPVSETVQDVVVAASVAAREPGLAVETVEGGEGAAADWTRPAEGSDRCGVSVSAAPFAVPEEPACPKQ
jgi:hypothetical protein